MRDGERERTNEIAREKSPKNLSVGHEPAARQQRG